MSLLLSRLLVLLLSGYIFIFYVPPFKFDSIRLSGQRILLHSLFFGVLLSITSAFLIPIIKNIIYFIDIDFITQTFKKFFYGFKSAIQIYEDSSYHVTNSVMLGLLLSIFFAVFSSALLYFSQNFRVFVITKVTYDPLEKLVNSAMQKGKLILLTLKSRKIYVGYVESNLDPTSAIPSLKISPYLSGFRDKDSLVVNFTNNYSEYLDVMKLYADELRKASGDNIQIEKIEIEVEGKNTLNLTYDRFLRWVNDYGVVIPWEEVESLTIWDQDIYNLVNDFEQYTNEPINN